MHRVRQHRRATESISPGRTEAPRGSIEVGMRRPRRRLASNSKMPSIDLARLRKQAARLADFFYVPDEFARQLNTVLDAYVNHTRRKAPAVAPGMHLPSHRTPAVVLKQIEQELDSACHGKGKRGGRTGPGGPIVG